MLPILWLSVLNSNNFDNGHFSQILSTASNYTWPWCKIWLFCPIILSNLTGSCVENDPRFDPFEKSQNAIKSIKPLYDNLALTLFFLRDVIKKRLIMNLFISLKGKKSLAVNFQGLTVSELGQSRITYARTTNFCVLRFVTIQKFPDKIHE